MPTIKPVAVISSTARDLPEHRQQVIDACHRCTCDYLWMEAMRASDDDAVKASMDLVDKADVYIGIFAHRYGYVPAGADISITEMEYDRAKRRGIPCLIFFMHDDHPVTKAMVETGPGADKLERFKQRIGVNHVAAFFKSAEGLRADVLHALPETLKKLQSPEAAAAIPSLHFVHPIPKPPEPYIAHYYALLQTGKIIGRRAELDRLTQWITKSPSPMMHVIAIGGMGKSALTWHWFHHIAAQEWPKMKGRIWWSFYESDGHFENFVTRSLAYVSGQSEAELRKQNLRDRCDNLMQILHKEPYLIVLDGLERILTAYARMDAPYLRDDDLDEKTLNAVMDAHGYPQGFYQAAVGRHRLRLAADPNVGRFLKVLCQPGASRILTSSRLFPADLQLPSGQAISGCEYEFLQGLNESDSLELWREYGCKGSSEKMLPIFRSFGFHPLVLRVFAGKVANYRFAPGDFDKWHEANPDFKPYGELVQVQSHILQHALRDISVTERQTLNLIAGLRMAAGIETLSTLLVEPSIKPPKKNDAAEKLVKACFDTLGELDGVLTLLEDRGLLGWDRRANRYDLHPIVRGVVWDLLRGEDQREVCECLCNHFAAMPTKDWLNIESVDDLTYSIELYDKLISLGRHDNACQVFYFHLAHATHNRLSAAQLRLGLLERLFPQGTDQPPRVTGIDNQSLILNSLALAYLYTGLPGKAAKVFSRAAQLWRQAQKSRSFALALCNVSEAERLGGILHMAEIHAREAILLARKIRIAFREAISTLRLGATLAMCGRDSFARLALLRAQSMLRGRAENDQSNIESAFNLLTRGASATEEAQKEGEIESALAESAILAGLAREGVRHADRAFELAQVEKHVADFIRVARLQGTAAMRFGDFSHAWERLHEALKRAHTCDRVEEELPTLIALAELHRQQKDPINAREYLDEVWDKCERGPYPLFHADAFNVLAQIERDADHKTDAIAAATQAYQKAWCDGPPFAYHWGLEAAKKHLTELGAPFPDMPLFDESKYPPMPELEINPRDEYYVDPEE